MGDSGANRSADRKGSPRQDLAARLEAHSIPEPNTGCCLWMGATSSKGFGQVRFDRRTIQATAAAWLVAFGVPVPSDKGVVQVCGQRACIEPAHLSLKARGGHRRAICKRGHPRTAENLWGHACKTCAQIKNGAEHPYRPGVGFYESAGRAAPELPGRLVAQRLRRQREQEARQ
jgi:hypothetical protein